MPSHCQRRCDGITPLLPQEGFHEEAYLGWKIQGQQTRAFAVSSTAPAAVYRNIAAEAEKEVSTTITTAMMEEGIASIPKASVPEEDNIGLVSSTQVFYDGGLSMKEGV